MYISTCDGPSDNLAVSLPQRNKGVVVFVALDPVRRLPQSTWMWCGKAILADWGALSKYFELLVGPAGRFPQQFKLLQTWTSLAAVCGGVFLYSSEEKASLLLSKHDKKKWQRWVC